ncbi:MAG: threonine aldolase family protein [Acidimicrobiia bacterium]
MVDLRSDTVTRPTARMRRAMADAEVGDDGWGEDPTVKRLEGTFAERVGKDAALFVPSGTMGNQIALRLLGRPGTAVVAGRGAHVVIYEGGAFGVNGWAQLQPVDDDEGTVPVEAVRHAVGASAHHWLPVSAVCVENTHMLSGGTCVAPAQLAAVAACGVPVHLDGARLFNAAVACGLAATAWTASATTVMCCLSKGLGAPVGSMLAGDTDLVAAARAERQRLGGGMRQVGILAAAGLVALEDHVERLADDHARAARLAAVVAERWPDPAGGGAGRFVTNCVVFRPPDPGLVIEHLRGCGVLAATVAPGVVRLVTHLDVDDAGIEVACAALASAPG